MPPPDRASAGLLWHCSPMSPPLCLHGQIPTDVLAGTLIPSVRFDRDFLSIVVAIIGTSLSAYIYTWESNQQVEEKIEDGKTRLSQRIGASDSELARSRRDVLTGMLFSNAVMYFIIMSTGVTLHAHGQPSIETAAQAA